MTVSLSDGRTTTHKNHKRFKSGLFSTPPPRPRRSHAGRRLERDWVSPPTTPPVAPCQSSNAKVSSSSTNADSLVPDIDDEEDSGLLSKSSLFSMPFKTHLAGVEHKAPVTVICLSSSPRERFIVCGSADHRLTVFDRHLHYRQVSLVGHSDQVRY